MYDYDVAFSFAGEDRWYVEKTFIHLKMLGAKIFYDSDNAADLWGKDLYQYLSDLYKNRAQYCVIFLSKHYSNKLWTKHELRSIQARAFQESREYILPARFDDTEIPGLLPTIGYIDLNHFTPEELAIIIKEKINAGKKISNNISSGNLFKLETELSDAVIAAEEYLSNIPLLQSDFIAYSIRNSFLNAELTPNAENLSPYLEHKRGPFRVVGYIAFQVGIKQGIQSLTRLSSILAKCLSKEKQEALEWNETRPLWQLLVCIDMITITSLTESKQYELKYELISYLDFLKDHENIDPGKECRTKIIKLINKMKTRLTNSELNYND